MTSNFIIKLNIIIIKNATIKYTKYPINTTNSASFITISYWLFGLNIYNYNWLWLREDKHWYGIIKNLRLFDNAEF